MIYIACVDGYSAEQFLPFVCEERRVYALKYKREPDRIRSLAGALLLEYAIRRAWHDEGIPVPAMYEDAPIRITHNADQKPEIFTDVPIPVPCFSMSHTGSYVAAATGRLPVGIDIERIRPCRESIVSRYYTKEEQAFIRRASQGLPQGSSQGALQGSPQDAAADLAFTQIWTLKESFLKATGLGMKLGIDSFSVIGENGDFTVQQDFDDHLYDGEILKAPDGYVLSVCRMRDTNTEQTADEGPHDENDNRQGGMIHEIYLSALLS